MGLLSIPLLWEIITEWLDNKSIERELDDMTHESEAARATAKARLRREKEDKRLDGVFDLFGCAGWGCLSGVGGCGLIAIILFIIGGIIGLALIGWDRLVS